MATMKYTLLYLGLLVASLILAGLIVPKDGPLKFYLLFAEVFVASVLLGLLVAQVTSITR
jgi:hypothetical protein